MGNKKKNLGEAELEIMQAIWNSEMPVTSNYILKELQGQRKWQLSTLMTSLSRLSDKGFISCDRSTGRNLYAPLVLETDYKAKESSHFLKKMYNNSIQNMIAALYDSREMKSSDVEELREFLDKLEEGQGQ
ncbi:MAG: BlaI/MecI/CopY family transcriptional regulator [Eubacterium sp.]|jgi:BlaI family penicillinase repressor|nr:BlaI/MecI/CopY family transcriptional regulator [Eubacterium sp.]